MKFNVNSGGYYKELVLSVDGTEINIARLFNEQEAKTLGKDLFEAAYELMDDEYFKEFIKEVYTKEELFGGEND